AQLVVERMGGDAEQPASQGEERPERLARAVDVQKRNLEEIVRRLRLAQRPQEEAVDARRPAAKEHRERAAIASSVRSHKLLVGQAIPLSLVRRSMRRGYGRSVSGATVTR